MKLLLPTLGSAGDIHPFLAIGRAMQERGHEVEVMTNPVFADMVAQAGLAFHPVGTQQHYIDAFNSRKLGIQLMGWAYCGGAWRATLSSPFTRVSRSRKRAQQAEIV